MSDATTLIAELERLCRHVAALQRDVQVLGGRIIPFEDENLSKAGAPPWNEYASLTVRGEGLTMAGLAKIVRQADWQLKHAEQDIGYIRSKIVEAESGNMTSDWRDWLSEHPARKRAEG